MYVENGYSRCMAAAASSRTDTRHPKIEEEALQLVFHSCESTISKNKRFRSLRHQTNAKKI